MGENMPQTKIAFLGLGLMGSGMAGRLLGAGFPLTVFNRNAERAAPLVQKGARLAGSPREAAVGAEIIISMLADNSASRAVWLGPEGALAGAAPGALLIESSTLTAGWVRELAAIAGRQKLDMIDAPVTGSRPAAAAGELVFLVGGTAEALARARPALAVMGRDIVHVGPLGGGAMLKLINNFVCGVQIVALAEAMTMIERSGLDPERAVPVLTNGAPGSPLVKMMGARMSARDYTPNFMMKLMAKDLAYAITEARGQSLQLASAEMALGVLKRAMESGRGDQDVSSVVEMKRAVTPAEGSAR
jgi:3-hydroxyisobutyrate dehydrogenase